jgi:hypothetical protein
MTRALGPYALVMAGTIAGSAGLLALAMGGTNADAAIGLSAIVAAVVQISAFAITRSLLPANMIAAWGAGALIRLLTLVAYGLIAVKVIGLPAVPALLSLFVFLFLSMLLEPLFLRR